MPWHRRTETNRTEPNSRRLGRRLDPQQGEGEGEGEGENEGEGEGEGEVSMTRGSQAVRLPMLASRHLYEYL